MVHVSEFKKIVRKLLLIVYIIFFKHNLATKLGAIVGGQVSVILHLHNNYICYLVIIKNFFVTLYDRRR